MSLVGKIAIITGGSKGLGAAIAKDFVKNGAKICITGRDEAGLKKVQSECNSISQGKQQVLILKGDLTDKDVRQQILDETIKKFGKLDILVNNAGIMKLGSTQETSLEAFDETFNINFRIPYDMSRLSIPHLLQSKGCIINMSSVVGIRPNFTVTAYAISKGAVDQLTTCLAAELGPEGVRVVSVNPAVIETDLWKLDGLPDSAQKELLNDLTLNHALKRRGKPDEVAAFVTFLASDKASFITGGKMLIDGGLAALPP